MAEKKPVQQAVPTEAETDAHVDDLVNKALKALEEFEDFTQEQVDYIVAKCSVAGLDHHGILAEAAVNETGRGVFEDKAVKNLFACEYVTNNLRHLKTVGIINEDPLTGITEIAEPVGVVCGIVPTTNPTSTVIFKSLIALKTRNPIIFSFHPSAHESSKQAAIVIRDAAIAAGAPENCIQWLSIKSMYATNALMNHPGVATILATGGNAMVKAAYSCGKPALGVGAGNVPAYVEKTCVLPRAVNDIVLSKSFDNGMICASEQAAIVDQEIYSDFMKEIKRFHVYFVNKEEKAKLVADNDNKLAHVITEKENTINKLKAEISDIQEKYSLSSMSDVELTLMDSSICKKIKFIEMHPRKKMSDEDWKELADTVEKAIPNFIPRLKIKLNDKDYQICLLIRLGFSTSLIARLLGLSDAAISKSRKTMLKKLCGKVGKPKEFDEYVLQIR